MKIAIHNKGSFSTRWQEYCEKKKIPYKLVSCYDNNIIEQLQGCSILLWHHNHYDFKDVITAKRILFALEHSGMKVFPDFKSGWHFDDKVAQKYLLEAIDAPIVPSTVFYDKKEALIWIEKTNFPKVFKLKGGAGSTNVKLVRNKNQAKKIIKKSFGRGFSQFNRIENLKERIRGFKNGSVNLIGLLKGFVRLVIPTEFAKMHGREKGYVYFQDFIPNNKSDLRVIIIREKAFAVKRLVRENDFRASGSGNIIYDRNEIDVRCIKIAFEVNKTIKSQSIAYDFIFDLKNNPLIVEISYGYAVEPYDSCTGYWDTELNWHEGRFNPQEWILQNLISEIKTKN